MPYWKPKHAHRRQTYYKVQVFNSVSLTWVDEPSAFDELDGANSYIAQTLGGKQSRIMVVAGGRRSPLKQ
jgi:hypothetical protein